MIKTHELRQSGAELAAVFAPLVRDGFLAVCEGGVELSKVRRRLLASSSAETDEAPGALEEEEEKEGGGGGGGGG